MHRLTGASAAVNGLRRTPSLNRQAPFYTDGNGAALDAGASVSAVFITIARKV